MNKSNLAGVKILVAGDIMLDQYWDGTVDRISPEAPVPIVKVNTCSERLGGAANVARNLKSLGVTPYLIGCIGKDEAGSLIKAELNKAGIMYSLVELDALKSIVKLRVTSKNHQMLRVDFEQEIPSNVASKVMSLVKKNLADVDAILLSDYGKGSLRHVQDIVGLCKKNNIPVVIDPKGTDYIRYKAATIITPNRNELKQVIGDWKTEEELRQKAEDLRKKLKLDAILLTRSEEGMTLFDGKGAHSINAIAHEVADVTGAGDTVIATLTAFLVAGSTLEDSMRLANLAAGIAVQQFGTACVTYDELMHQPIL
jgi:rfaE bifunctional protein kinase chain/domain